MQSTTLASSAGTSCSATHDQAADFQRLLVGVLPKAYAAARALTRNAADAEDLVQDAALLALRGFAGFEAGTNFRAWFMRILTNAFYMKCRTQRRRAPTVSLDEPQDLYLYAKLATPETAAQDPARAFMGRMDTEAVTEALQGLQPEYRVVATLFFIEDLSYEEIASTLECPVGTVRSRLHRARRLLQAALWKVAEDHGLV